MPVIELHCEQPVVLQGVPGAEAKTLAGYKRFRGYEGLAKALQGAPDAIVEAIEASQLRGRGGAGFPAGKKWRSVDEQPGQIKSVVANADEGDHGSYIDRFIMEFAPHRLIEALIIAGYAVGANQGYIYLRKEYPLAKVSLEAALEEARDAGWLGESVAGTPFEFEIDLVIGQGSYVCGEETSLLNSIEHRRPEVRARPPYPTEEGLFGMPTLVNNVETLSSVPWIVLNGGEAYAEMGHSTSRGTKAVSLSSLFNRPGLYEIEFGMPLREILYDLGGGLKTGEFKAVMVGGPLAGLIHPDEFDVPFAFDEMQAIGAAVGHGGIVGFDQNTSMAELLAHIFTFGAAESCGKCTPCRVGSRRAEQIFRKMAAGQPLSPGEQAEMDAVTEAMRKTSLCGHGTGLGEVAQSVFQKFSEELQPCFA
jgi:NADH:ubiquinone oxidoreductase subunit F (NADH-binding)